MIYLEFKAGAATQDAANPPTEDGQGLYFAADGNPHIVGWSVFVSEDLRDVSPLNLKLLFLSTPAGVAGYARFQLTYYTFSDSGPILSTGSEWINVGVLNPDTIYKVTLDISSWITSDTTVLLIQMARDSSIAGDTLADGIYYMDGVTDE